MQFQRTLALETPGRGSIEITADLNRVVSESGMGEGLCVIACMHTSASLLITENADPDVQVDLLSWLERLAPEGEAKYTHVAEGPDDMPAHLRAAITRSNETLPVKGGKLALGAWQGVFLLEHRSRPHRREVLVHVQGGE